MWHRKPRVGPPLQRRVFEGYRFPSRWEGVSGCRSNVAQRHGLLVARKVDAFYQTKRCTHEKTKCRRVRSHVLQYWSVHHAGQGGAHGKATSTRPHSPSPRCMREKTGLSTGNKTAKSVHMKWRKTGLPDDCRKNCGENCERLWTWAIYTGEVGPVYEGSSVYCGMEKLRPWLRSRSVWSMKKRSSET